MSWPLVQIGRYAEKVRTWNPAASSDEIFRYIDLSSVDKNRKIISLESVAEISSDDAPSRARQLVLSGDVLIATVRPNLNGVAMVPMELDGATASTGYCVVRADEINLHGRYLYYWVQTVSFVEDMMSKATGANYPAVSDKIIKDSQIPLPPLPEQKRIAAILDKAAAIRRKRQQAIQLADEFLRSAFLDMFGDPVTNPKGWEICRLEQLSTRITKGESPKWQGFEYGSEGVRFITSENVLWGSLDERIKFIPLEFHKKLKRSQVQESDLLINLVGASVGRACLAKLDGVPANINQAVSVTTLDLSRLLPEMALYQLLVPSMQRVLLGSAVDAARANISLADIRDLQMLTPPMDLQLSFLEVLRKVQKYMAVNSVFSNSNLFGSLSQSAFSGRL